MARSDGISWSFRAMGNGDRRRCKGDRSHGSFGRRVTTASLLVRLALAGVLGVAAAAKLADQPGARRSAVDFGVPERAASPVGLGVPVAELTAAGLLLFPATARWGALLALLLLVFFAAAIGVTLSRGRTPDCHCFGQLHSAPVGWPTLARNVVLAAAAAWVAVAA